MLLLQRPFLPAAVLLTGFLLAVQPWSRSHAQEIQDYTDECLACHDDYAESLTGSAHDLETTGDQKSPACSNCHQGAAEHIEDPNTENISNPFRLSVSSQAALCRSCHYTDHQQYMAEGNIHSENEVTCVDCHQVHRNQRFGLLSEEQPGLCYRCHQNVRSDFSTLYRHPVMDGIMTCTDCHTDLAAADPAPGLSRSIRTCYKCHNEFQGPFPFEHQATVEYSTEEGGCLNCHSPHGSNLPRLLTQPMEPPNYALCAQCHLVPGHKYDSYHGAEWANRACNDCHVDVHGSYVSRKLLKPTLPAEEGQNCFGSGCHQL